MRKLNKFIHYVQCEPGIAVLTLQFERNNEPVGVTHDFVVALGFDAETTVPTPISWDGAVLDNFAILHPNRGVYVPGSGESFDTPSHWLSYCIRRWKESQLDQSSITSIAIEKHGRELQRPSEASTDMTDSMRAIHAALNAARERNVLSSGEVS